MSSGTGSAQLSGALNWRLSQHPITLLSFLGFRAANVVIYIFGLFVFDNYVMVFIITAILLSVDFYFAKNIAGRRLAGLRWWNNTDRSEGADEWRFESADPAVYTPNPTDRRFFWIAMYAHPTIWVALAVIALIKFQLLWLILDIIALTMTFSNTVAFSRCDKHSPATQVASNVMSSGFMSKLLTGSITQMFRSGS